MRTAAIVAAACGAAAVVFLLLLARRARFLASRAARLSADALEARSGRPPLVEARATHLRTLHGGEDACLPDFPAGLGGTLSVSDFELVLEGPRSMHVPLARIVEALFLRQFEGQGGDGRGIVVRVTWERGGERLQSVFLIDGRRVDAERIRKEIHVRAGRAPKPPMPDGVRP